MKDEKVERPFVATKDRMVRKLLQRMSERSNQGLIKYKIDMDHAKKPFNEWVDDVQEELWDAIVYLEKVRAVLKKAKII